MHIVIALFGTLHKLALSKPDIHIRLHGYSQADICMVIKLDVHVDFNYKLMGYSCVAFAEKSTLPMQNIKRRSLTTRGGSCGWTKWAICSG